MALFAAEMMTENAEAAPIPRKVVYTAYVYWCEDTGRGKMNATNFYRGIERIPFVESNRVAAGRVLEGFDLDTSGSSF